MKTFSFIDKVRSQSKENLYLVKGKDRGIDCWYYVDVPKVSESLFSRHVVEGVKFDLNKYGKIIVSGWGTDPHEHIIKKIEESGSSYNPANDAEWQKIIDAKTNIYFVQAKDGQNRDFHAYVAVHGLLADQFIADATRGNINANDYGDIVKIDWGYPSEETKQEMTEKYGVDHNYIDTLLADA